MHAARKAILGLDTVKNRSVPPLRHEWVLRLMDDFPALKFTLNGGVTSLAAAAELLARGVHGVMIGRRSSADPYMFAAAASVYAPPVPGGAGANSLTRSGAVSAGLGHALASAAMCELARAPLQPVRALMSRSQREDMWKVTRLA